MTELDHFYGLFGPSKNPRRESLESYMRAYEKVPPAGSPWRAPGGSEGFSEGLPLDVRIQTRSATYTERVAYDPSTHFSYRSPYEAYSISKVCPSNDF